MIGFCGFIPFTDELLHLQTTGTIIQMYIRVAYRGKKAGFNLVKEVIQEAFVLPEIGQIILEVWKENIRAIRVYEQAGFQIYEPEVDGFEGDMDGQLMLYTE